MTDQSTTGGADVLPYQSCVVCDRGDTTTKVAIHGDAEYAVAIATRYGVPEPAARSMIGSATTSPDGVHVNFRVCVECAGRAGLPLGEAYVQRLGSPIPKENA